MFEFMEKRSRFEYALERTESRLEVKRELWLALCGGTATFLIRKGFGWGVEGLTDDIVSILGGALAAAILVPFLEFCYRYVVAGRQIAEERADRLADELAASIEEKGVLADELASVRETPSLKEIRLFARGYTIAFTETGTETAVFVVAYGITLTNPNDFVVDLMPSLEIEVENGGRIGTPASPLPMEQIVADVPARDRMILGRHLGTLVTVGATRTISGYVAFQLNTLMSFPQVKAAFQQRFVKCFFSVRDHNRSASGTTPMVLHGGAISVVRAAVSAKQPVAALRDSVDASSSGTPHTDDNKSE